MTPGPPAGGGRVRGGPVHSAPGRRVYGRRSRSARCPDRLAGVRGLTGDGLVAGADRAVGVAADLDAPRLGLLGHRYRQGQDAVVVVGADGVETDAVTEDELAGEGAGGPLGDEVFGVLGAQSPTFGPDGEGVVLGGYVEGLRVDAGQVEVQVERVSAAVALHRHRGRHAGRAEEFVGQPVEITERVESQQHGCVTSSSTTANIINRRAALAPTENLVRIEQILQPPRLRISALFRACHHGYGKV